MFSLEYNFRLVYYWFSKYVINWPLVHWHIMIYLTHWGRVTHICVSKLSTTDSDNSLAPGRRQAIIKTNAGILLIWPLETHFSEILIGIQTFSFKKMDLKISSVKWRPFCLGHNVLKDWFQLQPIKKVLLILNDNNYVIPPNWISHPKCIHINAKHFLQNWCGIIGIESVLY